MKLLAQTMICAHKVIEIGIAFSIEAISTNVSQVCTKVTGVTQNTCIPAIQIKMLHPTGGSG